MGERSSLSKLLALTAPVAFLSGAATALTFFAQRAGGDPGRMTWLVASITLLQAAGAAVAGRMPAGGQPRSDADRWRRRDGGRSDGGPVGSLAGCRCAVLSAWPDAPHSRGRHSASGARRGAGESGIGRECVRQSVRHRHARVRRSVATTACLKGAKPVSVRGGGARIRLAASRRAAIRCYRRGRSRTHGSECLYASRCSWR